MTATILVVDDLEPNVKLLEAKLLKEYYTVLSAFNGKQALEVLRNRKVDIVLLDVMMPEMDGFETCRMIKSDPQLMHIPVVMVTALSDIEDRVKGLEAGADEFLNKPVNDTALFARVRSLTRTVAVFDELRLRNKTNNALGAASMDLTNQIANSKILVIDDDIVQAKNISKILLSLTPNIKQIYSYEEATIDNMQPDAVIISCQMQEEDPLRLVAMLRSKEIMRNSAIMLLAEEETIRLVTKGLEVGANDYFIYPVDKNELLARMSTQLKRKEYLDHLKDQLDESVNMSIKDGLTNLYNRRFFDLHLEQMATKAIEEGKPLAVLMMDMDHFKEVNDTYGHPAGDAVLKDLSAIIKNCTRLTDLTARYGGEEFVIVLNNANKDDALSVGERIRKRVEEHEFLLPDGRIIHKTVSIGVSEFNPDLSLAEWVENADKALYEAKDTTRNRVVVFGHA